MNLLSIVRQIKATSAYPTYNPAGCWVKPTAGVVIPVVVVTDKRSINFVKTSAEHLHACVIRAGDFVTRDGTRLKKNFEKVRNAGGLAAYFGIELPILLSFIMDDDRCFGIRPDVASELIQGLRVSAATTFDTATYTNQRQRADQRMAQIRENNRLLISANPDTTFIGVVKGCYPKQIEDHISELKSLGIQEFIFHAGDYLNRGSWSERKALRLFAGLIRNNVPFLYFYGIGSRSSFELIPYADGIITLSHIIETKNGRFTDTNGHVSRAGKFEANPSTVQTTLNRDILSDTRDMLYEAKLTFNRIVEDFALSRRNAEDICQANLFEWHTPVSISLDYATSCMHCQGCPAGWC